MLWISLSVLPVLAWPYCLAYPTPGIHQTCSVKMRTESQFLRLPSFFWRVVFKIYLQDYPFIPAKTLSISWMLLFQTMGRKWLGLQGSSSVVHSCNPRQLICTTPDMMVHTYNLKHGDSYLQFQAWWLKPAIPGMVVHTCNPRHGSSYLQPQAGLYLQSQAWWLICSSRHGDSYLQSQAWCLIPAIPGMVSHTYNNRHGVSYLQSQHLGAKSRKNSRSWAAWSTEWYCLSHILSCIQTWAHYSIFPFPSKMGKSTTLSHKTFARVNFGKSSGPIIKGTS